MIFLLRRMSQGGSVTFAAGAAQMRGGVGSVRADRHLCMIAPAMPAGVQKISLLDRQAVEHEELLGPQIAAKRRLEHVQLRLLCRGGFGRKNHWLSPE